MADMPSWVPSKITKENILAKLNKQGEIQALVSKYFNELADKKLKEREEKKEPAKGDKP